MAQTISRSRFRSGYVTFTLQGTQTAQKFQKPSLSVRMIFRQDVADATPEMPKQIS
jgi:hypothetical protein